MSNETTTKGQEQPRKFQPGDRVRYELYGVANEGVLAATPLHIRERDTYPLCVPDPRAREGVAIFTETGHFLHIDMCCGEQPTLTLVEPAPAPAKDIEPETPPSPVSEATLRFIEDNGGSPESALEAALQRLGVIPKRIAGVDASDAVELAYNEESPDQLGVSGGLFIGKGLAPHPDWQGKCIVCYIGFEAHIERQETSRGVVTYIVFTQKNTSE